MVKKLVLHLKRVLVAKLGNVFFFNTDLSNGNSLAKYMATFGIMLYKKYVRMY